MVFHSVQAGLLPDQELKPIPDPAEVLPEPNELKTTEELYLAATHLEQYRHATFEPADYYLEGLKRDPSDIRLNNGYGLYLYRKGEFKNSEKHFRQAIRKQTWKNPNPYLGETYFNLGLVLLKLGSDQEAYDAFFKATWSGEVQSAAFYQLGCLSCKQHDYESALKFANQAIAKNADNQKAYTLKAAIQRLLGHPDQLELEQAIARDPLNHGSHYELGKMLGNLVPWQTTMREEAHNYLELALEYLDMGLFYDALMILEICPDTNPMLVYYQAYIYTKLDQINQAQVLIAKAESISSDYVFPNRLDEILILENAIILNPEAGYAHYYLGNLFYDKKQYTQAIQHWETSASLIPNFPTNYRNLSLAYYNKCCDNQGALTMIRRAFAINPNDARLLLELDQLMGKSIASVQERLQLLEANLTLTESRDDLYLEYITLLNCIGQHDRAYECIINRNFHPWEGGEGKVSGQYIFALVEKAKIALANSNYHEAINLLQSSLKYPANLGEGKLPNAMDNITYYYLGMAYLSLGETDQAQEVFMTASIGMTEPSNMMYYNDQPADTILYQGFACDQLGKTAQAKSRYHKLISYGEKHLFDQVKYDYFAVSLPDTMIYQDDISLRNEIYCNYLIALGKLGLGEKTEAREKLEKVLRLSPHHQGAIRHIHMM